MQHIKERLPVITLSLRYLCKIMSNYMSALARGRETMFTTMVYNQLMESRLRGIVVTLINMKDEALEDVG